MPARIPACLALLAILSLLYGCLSDGDGARGHVVENEVLAGYLFAENGDPAAGAEVSAVPVEYVPHKGLLKSANDTLLIRTYRADSMGRYEMKDLPKGQYNLIGRWRGALSLQDSVVVDEKVDSIYADTLQDPGSLTGTVELEPNHDPRAVFVQVLGTDRFANTDSLGRFTLEDMADGKYSLRILTTYPEYTPKFLGVAVRAGHSDTLSQSIRLVYTGIPVVRGLKASFDTVTGKVRLTWKAARYPFLKDYLIYRKSKATLDYSLLPKAVTDTILEDSLTQAYLENLEGTGPGSLEYQVRVRNLSNEPGKAFGSARVDAAPIRSITTSFRFTLGGQSILEASIGDMVRLVAQWENPNRPQDSLFWQLEEDGRILRATALQGLKGFDTLLLPLPGKAGVVAIKAIARDKAGSEWIGKAKVMVLAVAPIADAGPDLAVTIRDTVRLVGKVKEGSGHIVKSEWSIGPGGAFQASPKGEAVFVSGDVGRQVLFFRVTDDDGLTGTDSMLITSYDDIPRVTLGSEGRLAADGGGYKLAASVVDRGRIVKWEWSIGSGNPYVAGSRGDTSFFPSQPAGNKLACKVRATDDDGNVAEAEVEILVSKWSFVGTIPFGSVPLAGLGSKLYAFGGSNYTLNQYRIYAFEIDPVTGNSKPIKPALENAPVVAGNGKLYTIGNTSSSPTSLTTIPVHEYDPRLDEWITNHTNNFEGKWFGYRAAFLGGKIYLAGGEIWNYASSRTLQVPFLEVDPARFESKHKAVPPFNRWNYGLAGLDGLVYAIGGRDPHSGPASAATLSPQVWAYDVAADTWSQKASLPVSLERCVAVAVGGKIFTVGGTEGKTWNRVFRYDPAADQWQEKSPMLFDAADFSATVLGGKIYAVDPSGKLQVYDPATEL